MKHWITSLWLAGLVWSCQIHSEELERSQLAGLVKEIDFLLIHVEEIKVEAPDHSRLRFQYEDLKNDLQLIREGISDYIDADLKFGRDLTPIQGSYH